MATSTSSIDDRLSRWKAFLDVENGPRFMFHVNFPFSDEESQLPPCPPLWPTKVRERVDRRWAEYTIMRRKAELVDDDRVPYLSNATGTEIFAEAFGCRVQRPGNTNPFALPLVWLNPRYAPVIRVVVTLVVLMFSYWAWSFTRDLIADLEAQMALLQEFG